MLPLSASGAIYKWSTHIVILFAAEPTVPFSEPEIGDLVHTVFDKDVSGFEGPDAGIRDWLGI